MTEKDRQNELAFKIYVTDAVKNINASVANMYGGNVMKLRYAEVIKQTKEETRKPEEIIDTISSKLDKMGQSDECI